MTLCLAKIDWTVKKFLSWMMNKIFLIRWEKEKALGGSPQWKRLRMVNKSGKKKGSLNLK
jgi:hypothetical protein